MDDVCILTTGGTLDKVHDWRAESLAFPEDGGSHVGDILAQGRCRFPRVEPLFQIDSLEMDDHHREAILKRVVSIPEKVVVVTHGTSTMGQTARYLVGRIADKTVVLTGAMRPHSLLVSDAGFNLGGAVVAGQILPPGVYGVMNGRVIGAGELTKDEARGTFAR